MEVIAHQVDGSVGLRTPADRAANAVFVAPVDASVVEQVLGIAVALEVGSGEADTERVAERDVDHALGAVAVVIAIFALSGDVEALEIGLGGDEVDDAGSGVAAVQCSLRTAQDFDPFEIEIIGFEDARTEQRQIVDVDRGRRIAGYADAQVADAADGEGTAGEVRLGESDIGQRQLEVRRVVDLLRGEALRGKGGNRDRHVLQALRRPLRGDDDLVESVVATAAGLRRGGDRAGVRRGVRCALREGGDSGEKSEERDSRQGGSRGRQAHDLLPRETNDRCRHWFAGHPTP